MTAAAIPAIKKMTTKERDVIAHSFAVISYSSP